jgi:hypothetical protein
VLQLDSLSWRESSWRILGNSLCGSQELEVAKDAFLQRICFHGARLDGHRIELVGTPSVRSLVGFLSVRGHRLGARLAELFRDQVLDVDLYCVSSGEREDIILEIALIAEGNAGHAVKRKRPYLRLIRVVRPLFSTRHEDCADSVRYLAIHFEFLEISGLVVLLP